MPPVRRRRPGHHGGIRVLDVMTMLIGAYGHGRRLSVDEARRLYLEHRDDIHDHCQRVGVAVDETACFRDFEPDPTPHSSATPSGGSP